MTRPVAVVTGAAHGIGLETARRLPATHRVALLDLDAAGAERAAAGRRRRRLGGCDITDPDAVRPRSTTSSAVRRHRRRHRERRHRDRRRHAPPRPRRPRRAARRQPRRQLALHPRVPAARHRAPRVRARGRVGGGDRRPGRHRVLRVEKAGFEHLLNVLRIEVATSASTSGSRTSRGSTPTWCAAPKATTPVSPRCAGACAGRRQDAARRRGGQPDRRGRAQALAQGGRAGVRRRAVPGRGAPGATPRHGSAATTSPVGTWCSSTRVHGRRNVCRAPKA